MERFWVVRMKICSNGPGHVNKMVAVPIYGKIHVKVFFKTSRQMTVELDIQYQRLGPYKVFLNDDAGLTLTYFLVRSTFVLNAFVWENA